MSTEQLVDDARQWLDRHAPLRKQMGRDLTPGDPFSTAVFHALDIDEEKSLLADLRSWQALKAERGYHAITWPVELGGLGLTREHAAAYGRLESEYETPRRHELFTVTTRLIAPVVRDFGTPHQHSLLLARLLRADIFCCQLFSEPGAGSDLAALRCRAVADGESWSIDGQKVWSSGAQFAEWGLLLARTDPDAPKHRGLTAFLVPMDIPGIEVRPIRQMSGGASFNEVFLSGVRVPDQLRLGDVGSGWEVGLATLGYERDHSDSGGSTARTGGSWKHVLATARERGGTDDPVVRQALMKLYVHLRIEGFVNRRAADLRAAGVPAGPEASLGKLFWTEGMRAMSDVVTLLLGPELVADSGRWGTYEWAEHVLGAPGYRIAGGSDEIQRNVIGERVLGLAAEPRVDKGVPWRSIPH